MGVTPFTKCLKERRLHNRERLVFLTVFTFHFVYPRFFPASKIFPSFEDFGRKQLFFGAGRKKWWPVYCLLPPPPQGNRKRNVCELFLLRLLLLSLLASVIAEMKELSGSGVIPSRQRESWVLQQRKKKGESVSYLWDFFWRCKLENYILIGVPLFTFFSIVLLEALLESLYVCFRHFPLCFEHVAYNLGRPWNLVNPRLTR